MPCGSDPSVGGGYLLSHFRSTIGVVRLNFSVRNGKRWNPHAITTFVRLSARPFLRRAVMRGTIDREHDPTRFSNLRLRNLQTGTASALTGLAAAASHGGFFFRGAISRRKKSSGD